MRAGNNAQFNYNENGQIWAVSLGSDHVSEHEWGIGRIYRDLGMDKSQIGNNPFGIDSRIIQTGKHVYCDDVDEPARGRGAKDRKGWVGTRLMLVGSYTKLRIDEEGMKSMQELYEYADVPTAWSESDFVVFARGQDESQFLKDLYEAMQNKDAIVWLGGGGVFKNAGLCFGIRSRAPQNNVDQFFEADFNKHKLNEAVAKTGIMARIEKAQEKHKGDAFSNPYRYYALSPKWISDSSRDKSKYEVMFWLNPMQQQSQNYGWYTVEQLDQWLEGKGPIPKQ